MDVEWCKSPDRGLPAPDVVFYMQLSIEEAMKRGVFILCLFVFLFSFLAFLCNENDNKMFSGGFGEERYEKKDFQVNHIFLREKNKKQVVKTIHFHFDRNVSSRDTRTICVTIRGK